jgi:hypothetical protein
MWVLWIPPPTYPLPFSTFTSPSLLSPIGTHTLSQGSYLDAVAFSHGGAHAAGDSHKGTWVQEGHAETPAEVGGRLTLKTGEAPKGTATWETHTPTIEGQRTVVAKSFENDTNINFHKVF